MATWQHFGAVQAERIRGDVPMAMPWLLNWASPQTREAVLNMFPAAAVRLPRATGAQVRHVEHLNTVGEPAS